MTATIVCELMARVVVEIVLVAIIRLMCPA